MQAVWGRADELEVMVKDLPAWVVLDFLERSRYPAFQRQVCAQECLSESGKDRFLSGSPATQLQQIAL